jgi:iron complex outermembrane receptor protein
MRLPTVWIPAFAGMTMVSMAAPAIADDDTYDPQQLPEIIVTAQKQSRTLEQTAASISSLDHDFMREIGARNFQDLADYTANISMTLSHGYAGTFAIRGFATPDTNPGFDPSVGAVIDGVYYGRSQFLSAFFHDVDRFEVLRGPQGTLFGKNCTAGVLNVVTREPGDEFSTEGALQYNGYGERSLRPAVSVPLGHMFGLRISGNYDTDDGGVMYNTYLHRPENDVHDRSTRVKLRFTPSWPLVVDMEAFRSDSKSNNSTFQFSQLTSGMRSLVQQYDASADDRLDFFNSANLDALSIATISGGSATAEYDLAEVGAIDEMRVTSITGYAESNTSRLDLDADFSPVPFIHDVLAEPKLYRQFSQELRASGENATLLGFGGKISFVGGLYYAQTAFHTSDIFAVESLAGAAAYCLATGNLGGQGPALGLPPTATGTLAGLLGKPLGDALALLPPGATDQYAQTRLHQTSPTLAVFGSFEEFVTEHWAILGGLRYSMESKDGLASSTHQGALIPAIANQVDHVTHIKRSEHELSPKAGLKWAPAGDTEVYGTWAQGYKSGGFNGLPLNPDNLEYEPELATSIEFGAKKKLEFLGGPARVSVALFNTTFEDLQVSTFLNGGFVVLNAASARSRGAEMDLHWLTPLPGASVYSSVGYADARYKSYPDAPALSDSGAQTQDLSGKRLSLAPRWTATFVPSYQLPLPFALGARFAVDVLYRSSRYLDVDDDARKLQPATRMYNARLTVEQLASRWSVTMGAHNLTNVQVYDQIIGQPLAPGNFVAFRTDRGRYYSADLSLNF